jgi:tetratricopeptide (TPR) repeat protein
MLARLLCNFLLLVLLGACATPPQSAALLRQAAPGIPEQALIEALPFFAQDDYQCGPAALAMVLGHSGIAVLPEALVSQVYLPGRKGSLQIEMSAAARQQGRLVYTLEPTLEDLLREVAAGHPVLVLQNLGLDILPRWHFAVVKGYELDTQQLILNSGRIENYRVSLATFERTWARADHWAQVILTPEQLPATAEPTALFLALAQLQETGQSDTAARGFTTALQHWPMHAMLLLGAGNLHYAQGDKVAALAHFRRALLQQPEWAVVHNNLAQLLFEQGQLEEAGQHARQAVALGGEFSAVYASTLEQISAARE